MNLVTLNKVKFDWLRYLSRKALSQGLRLQGFFFSYQKPTDFNRKRLIYIQKKPLYLHLTLNVLDE